MPERCQRCDRQRVLQDYRPNQIAVLRLCAACVKDATEKRSEAATGKAGPKPKSASQLEDQLWRLFLSGTDSRVLELWLVSQGYTGTRGQMLKRWALATIESARKR